MTTAIATTQPTNYSLALAGQAANHAAAGLRLAEYLQSKSANTLRAQAADLRDFAAFLVQAGIEDAPDGDMLQYDPAAWAGVTHGLVLAYREWMMQLEYSIATVNRRLATVKVYASLGDSYDSDIATVRGFGHKAGRNRDEKRAERGLATRIGSKKPYKAVTLTYEQARMLKQHPDTPQGRRDALLMCLLLDHGLRVGEVALLQVTDFDLATGPMRFYRPKVDKVQTHKLTGDTMRALAAWQSSGDAPASGPILRGSRKGGILTYSGMSERAITARVRQLGKRLEIANLSAHDCRHYWASRATQQGTHPKALQQAGGWNSPAMVMRYVDESEVANEGVRL